jgi:hypothetical protein
MHLKKSGIKPWMIFILLLVIVFGGLFFLKSVPDRPSAKNTAEEAKSGKSFANIPELSEEQKKQIDTEAIRNASLSGSSTDCDKIIYDEKLKLKCYDNFYYAQAIKLRDENLCAKIDDADKKAECYDKVYFSAAIDAFDSSLCQKIKNKEMLQGCINQLGAFMGRTAKNISDCDFITSQSLKQECLNNFYFSSGIDSLDKTGCDKISDSRLKSRCVSTIDQNLKVTEISKTYAAEQPKTVEETIKTCDAMTGESAQGCKDQANYSLAFEKKDLSYCSRITDSAMQQSCIKEQTENLDQYYLRVAMATVSPPVCNKIINTSLKSFCLDSVKQ